MMCQGDKLRRHTSGWVHGIWFLFYFLRFGIYYDMPPSASLLYFNVKLNKSAREREREREHNNLPVLINNFFCMYLCGII